MIADSPTRALAAALIAFAGAGASPPAAAQDQTGGEGAAEEQADTPGVEIQQTGAAASEGMAQGCLEEVRALSDALNQEDYSPAARPMQTLYDAAVVFANNGQTEACRSVVDGMRAFMDEASAEPPIESATLAELENAPRVSDTDAPVRMSRLLDAVVLTPDGQALGDIDEMVTLNDTRYLLIGTGGFLGMGEDYVPVRMDRFRYAGPDTLVLDVDPARFEDAPSFDTTDLAATMQAWAQDVESWWENEVTGPN